MLLFEESRSMIMSGVFWLSTKAPFSVSSTTPNSSYEEPSQPVTVVVEVTTPSASVVEVVVVPEQNPTYHSASLEVENWTPIILS